MKELRLRVHLDKVLSERGMTQIELVKKLNEIRTTNGIKRAVRAASISELYNNQRKTLNKELIEEIANALSIDAINELITFE